MDGELVSFDNLLEDALLQPGPTLLELDLTPNGKGVPRTPQAASDRFDAPTSRSDGKQRARSFSVTEIGRLTRRYRVCATVYGLATGFGIDRRTVAIWLKAAGVSIQHTAPATQRTMIDELVLLYASGFRSSELEPSRRERCHRRHSPSLVLRRDASGEKTPQIAGEESHPKLTTTSWLY